MSNETGENFDIEQESWLCVVCSQECVVTCHSFFEGSPERPNKQWLIEAPLYFKATPDGRGCEAGFCSPECATEFYLR